MTSAPASATVTRAPVTPTPPGPTALPADAPGGPAGRIVFLSFRDVDREIYIVNTDGSGETNLTRDPGVDENPDVSPDGERIVWTSDRGGGELHLWVMDIDGGNVRQLTFGDGGEMSPRWSRDGESIAFSRAGSIWVMPAAGGEETLVMEAIDEKVAPACRAGAFPGGWSPDDRRVVYYSASPTKQEGQVCTVDVETLEVMPVVSRPGEYNVEPAWSPDGRFLAYRGIRGEETDIYVYDFETAEERRLTNHPDLDIEPSWSPDGQWIAFPSMRENVFFDIFIMRADGTEVRRLTTDPAKDSEPVWVP